MRDSGMRYHLRPLAISKQKANASDPAVTGGMIPFRRGDRKRGFPAGESYDLINASRALESIALKARMASSRSPRMVRNTVWAVVCGNAELGRA